MAVDLKAGTSTASLDVSWEAPDPADSKKVLPDVSSSQILLDPDHRGAGSVVDFSGKIDILSDRPVITSVSAPDGIVPGASITVNGVAFYSKFGPSRTVTVKFRRQAADRRQIARRDIGGQFINRYHVERKTSDAFPVNGG